MAPIQTPEFPHSAMVFSFDERLRFFLLGAALHVRTASELVEAMDPDDAMGQISLDLISDIGAVTIGLLEAGARQETPTS